MIQTYEAIVDETGKIRLLTEVHLKKKRRALFTILDEEPREVKASKKENLRAVFDKMRGVELRGIENVSQWQRKIGAMNGNKSALDSNLIILASKQQIDPEKLLSFYDVFNKSFSITFLKPNIA